MRFATGEERSRWADWLKRLFGLTPEMPQLRGAVVDVALGSAEEQKEERVTFEGTIVRLQHLNEVDVERLLGPPEGESPGASGTLEGDHGGPSRPPKEPPSGAPGRAAVTNSATVRTADSEVPTSRDSSEQPFTSRNRPLSAGGLPGSETSAAGNAVAPESWSVTLGTTKEAMPVIWPPSIRGNPHLMIVGLPGMGKTTCLINICRQLHGGGIAPIVFSYHAVIFDEAHRASRLKLLPTMAKECRKYGLALIVASQEARDFDAGLFGAIANYLLLRVTDRDARRWPGTWRPQTWSAV